MNDRASLPAQLPQLEVAAATDVGLQREHNEDYLGDRSLDYPDRLISHGRLFAVADGMGGHALGEVASQLAVETLFQSYYEAPSDDLAAALHAAVEAANAAVFRQGRRRGVSMGTTLTMTIVHGATLMVANVGDSRVYRLRNRRLQQLTHDHSLVAEQLRRGILTVEQARQSRSHNVLTRCVGYRPIVEVDLSELPVQVDDVMLLCSDGLHGLVRADELAEQMALPSLATAAQQLIALANQRGGIDNSSCLLIRVVALPELPDPMAEVLDETGDLDSATVSGTNG